MNRVRIALGHVWEVSIIAVLFFIYVVGLTGATILTKARGLVANDSNTETELAE